MSYIPVSVLQVSSSGAFTLVLSCVVLAASFMLGRHSVTAAPRLPLPNQPSEGAKILFNASSFGVSVFALVRVFTALLGESYHQYFISLCMRFAELPLWTMGIICSVLYSYRDQWLPGADSLPTRLLNRAWSLCSRLMTWINQAYSALQTRVGLILDAVWGSFACIRWGISMLVYAVGIPLVLVELGAVPYLWYQTRNALAQPNPVSQGLQMLNPDGPIENFVKVWNNQAYGRDYAFETFADAYGAVNRAAFSVVSKLFRSCLAFWCGAFDYYFD